MAASSKQPSPNTNMSMSAKGKQRLANRESLVLRYYDDGGKGKGNCTYGYGTKVSNRPCTPTQLKTEVTKEKAEKKLGDHIIDVEVAIRRAIRIPLNQDQFDALVSYSYNTGIRGAGSVLAAVNANDFALATKTMRERIYSRQSGKLVLMPGLISRREEESAPFEVREQ